jgi:hypothetical protein
VSVEITAAIIGGLISGAVVLIGVVLANYLTRRQDREQHLKAAVRLISTKVTEALLYAGPKPPHPGRLDYGTPGFLAFNNVLDALYEVDLLSPGLRGKKMVEVRQLTGDINARLAAVQLRLHRGITLTMDEVWTLTIRCGDLNGAVFGEGHLIDELVRRYDQQGFGD